MRPWPLSQVSAGGRKILGLESPNVGFQRGLIALGDEQVVRLFVLNPIRRPVCLRVQGIGRHQGAGELKGFQKRIHRGNLVQLLIDSGLGDNPCAAMDDRRHQMPGFSGLAAGTPESFAIAGDGLRRAILRHPVRQNAIQRCGITALESTPYGRFTRRNLTPLKAGSLHGRKLVLREDRCPFPDGQQTGAAGGVVPESSQSRLLGPGNGRLQRSSQSGLATAHAIPPPGTAVPPQTREILNNGSEP